MNNLDIKFRKLWNDLSLAGEPTEVYRWLANKYSDPSRHYHTLEHIDYGLNAIDTLVAPMAAMQDDSPGVVEFTNNLVRFAFFFHDSMPDETRSADIAEFVLTVARRPSNLCKAIERLILLTTHRSEPEAYLEKVMVDADLAIFASDQETFDAYETNVRKEFAKYSDSDYAKGRIKILGSFLKRKSVYYTIYGLRELEDKARANLMASIKKLSADV